MIILTAYDWSNIETEARAAGVTSFCSKPMFMSDLRETLLTAIGQQESKRAAVRASFTRTTFAYSQLSFRCLCAISYAIKKRRQTDSPTRRSASIQLLHPANTNEE